MQQEILRVVVLVVRAASEHLADLKRTKLKEIFPANQSITDIPAPVSLLGEGGEEGVLKPGTSTAFAVLEVFRYNHLPVPVPVQLSMVLNICICVNFTCI